METVQIQIFTFSELGEKAQQRAIDSYRNAGHGYFWNDEYRDSLKAFGEHFGVKLIDWSIGTCSYSYIRTDAENRHFRGRKLKHFDREHMPTGFCADCDLWATFYDVFKRSGDAKLAFNEALDAFIKSWVADMEGQESDEYIADHLEANGYTYTADGRQFHH